MVRKHMDLCGDVAHGRNLGRFQFERDNRLDGVRIRIDQTGRYNIDEYSGSFDTVNDEPGGRDQRLDVG